MKHSASNKNRRRLGILTFEWILLITVLVIGIIGGIGLLRNVLIVQLRGLAHSVEGMNFHDDHDDDDGHQHDQGHPWDHGNGPPWDPDDGPPWGPGGPPWNHGNGHGNGNGNP